MHFEIVKGIMGKVILNMVMSLDGFIDDATGKIKSLYPDLKKMLQTPVMKKAVKETGAVVMGKGTYDLAENDFTGYEYQVPLFIQTHKTPDEVAKGANKKLKFNFISAGIRNAIDKAKAAAGKKNVMVVGGADTAQQCIKNGLVDELWIHIRPVLLCGGKRLFEYIGLNEITLEALSVIKYELFTHLSYRLGKKT